LCLSIGIEGSFILGVKYANNDGSKENSPREAQDVDLKVVEAESCWLGEIIVEIRRNNPCSSAGPMYQNLTHKVMETQQYC